jgi:hypothetical protein
LCYAFHLEFEAKQISEYESIFLRLNMDKDMGIKILKIQGDSDLVILQVKNQFACKNDKFERYINAVWDAMEWFDALSLEVENIMFNERVDALVVATSTLQP